MLTARLLTTIPALALSLALSFPAMADQRHCPTSTRRNSHVVCGNGCDQDADKARLEILARSIVTTKSSVCLLALVDPQDPGYSRKLAIKRVLWVRDTLVEQGVLSDSIAVELRPLLSGADKEVLRHIDIIFGR